MGKAQKILGMNLPLNALRAFEVSARHLSFTRAAIELNVTQTAVSAQVRNLEDRLGTPLFRRLPRGLALTDEAQALLPMLTESFDRIGAVLDQFQGGRFHEVLTVAAVGTFAVGWLMPRLDAFYRQHPFIDLRLMTNNNRVDLAGETLLRSYRADEWTRWFGAAGVAAPLLRGPVFDSSLTMAAAAVQGGGVALLPPAMIAAELQQERLVQPFDIEVSTGRYWLTRLKSRPVSPAMREFRRWLLSAVST